jgi:pyruvate kinase
VPLDGEFMNRAFTRIDQSIAMSALFVANHLPIRGIVALTQSGSTALWMSRFDSGVPIYALTSEERTRRRMTLYREVHPMQLQPSSREREAVLLEAEQTLVAAGVVSRGDRIIITIGEPIGKAGGTNTMKIVTVGDHG